MLFLHISHLYASRVPLQASHLNTSGSNTQKFSTTFTYFEVLDVTVYEFLPPQSSAKTCFLHRLPSHYLEGSRTLKSARDGPKACGLLWTGSYFQHWSPHRAPFARQVPCEWVVVAGDPREEIPKFVESHPLDMVVVGNRGLSALAR
jgi:hypothetical protein